MNRDELIALATKISEGTATDNEIEIYHLFFKSFDWHDDKNENLEFDAALGEELLKRINANLNSIEEKITVGVTDDNPG